MDEARRALVTKAIDHHYNQCLATAVIIGLLGLLPVGMLISQIGEPTTPTLALVKLVVGVIVLVVAVVWFGRQALRGARARRVAKRDGVTAHLEHKLLHFVEADGTPRPEVTLRLLRLTANMLADLPGLPAARGGRVAG